MRGRATAGDRSNARYDERMETRRIDVRGPVNVADFGGSGPAMVLVHGLGGSHVNWMLLGPLLAERARVLAPDMAGFGKTPPAGRGTDVSSNARLLRDLVREEIGGPAILVGNSMGALISLLLASERPDLVAGLILVGPAVPVAPGVPRDRQVTLAFTAYMTPGVGELFVRRRREVLGPEGLVDETFRLCCVDPSRVPDEVIEAHVDMVRARTRMPWADASVLRAARSLLREILRRRRFLARLARVDVPGLILQGEHDRFITSAAARLLAKARPAWTYRDLDGLGHIPHLEDPERTAREIFDWLDGSGRESAERSRAGRKVEAV
jgi:pimeloyl-ACP methyl ester carboxylesterase